MKLESTIALHAEGEAIRRDPRFWDKLKKVFGGKPNLDTERVRSGLTTAHLVQGVKKALERVGVTNAVALVIDGQVLFEDRSGKADDVGDLFVAFYANEAVYGRDFKDLRLTVEHAEAGLHVVIEIVGRGEHADDEATANVLLSGRVVAFEPQPGEDAAAFRARVEPHLATPTVAESHRLQFEAFVARVRAGLAAAMPDVRVSEAEVRTIVERPPRPERERHTARGAVSSRRAADEARGRSDDPYNRYYPSPLRDVATLLFWSSLVSWAWTPSYVIVDASGAEAGTTDTMPGEREGRGDEVGTTDEGGDDGEWDGGAFDGDADW